MSDTDGSLAWRRRPAVALVATWAACLAVLGAWTLWTPAWVLRQQLVVLQFWSLNIGVVLAVASSILVLRDVFRLIDRRGLLAMMLAVFAGVALTLGVAPRTNRIFFDEQIYQNVGQNLADLGRAQMCNDGAIVRGHLRCSSAEYNKQPYAYPHLLSLAYRVFGAGETPAFVVNAAAMGLSICGVYVLGAVLFSNRVAAFFAALILALTPQQLIWSASAAAEPSASAACIAALVAAACFVRLPTTRSLVALVIIAAYAIQFRPESLLIVAVIAVLIWQRARSELTSPRFWWAGLLFVALATVHLAHTASVRNEGWGTTQARMSLSYVADNLRANGWFYLADARFPAAYTALALFGLWGGRRDAGRLTLACYFLLFFGIALLFYAGSYDYGADVRYSLATYPPLAILGGLGLGRLAHLLKRSPLGPISVAAVTVALVGQFLWYLPVVRSSADGAWAARADVEFARTLVRDLPPNAYVLTQDPGMFQLWGVSAGQTSLAVNEPARLDDLERRYTGGLYLHWNFWCNVQDPIQRGFCARILELRTARKVREQWTRDQRYALYRLDASAPSR
jgi:hypothetical protein